MRNPQHGQGIELAMASPPVMAVHLNIWFNMVGTGRHEGSALVSHSPARAVDEDKLVSLLE